MSSPRIRTVFLLIPVLLLSGSSVAPAPDLQVSQLGQNLRGYLSVDTSNPPGREHAGAVFLADILERESIDYRFLTTEDGRTSLYARLEADEGPSQGALVLLHHIDVVLPGPGWRSPPFSGTLYDEALWGRGAVDAKSLGIVQLEALLTAARDPRPRNRDLVFLAVADEERGGLQGSDFILKQHPELLEDTVAVLNEGGSNRMANGRLSWFGIEVAQKRPLWLRLSTSGRGGHAATYNPGSALHTLSRAIPPLLDLEHEWRAAEPVRDYLRNLAPMAQDRWTPLFGEIERYITPEGPTVKLMPGMEALFTDTLQVTRLQGSDQINVVAAEAIAEVDLRLLPDTDDTEVLERIRQALGPRVSVEVLVSAPVSDPSPVDHPVFHLLEEALAHEGPIVPYFSAGFTDSRFFRERGIPAYGFSPFALEPNELRGVHGPNEKVSLKALKDGAERMKRVVDTWLYNPHL